MLSIQQGSHRLKRRYEELLFEVTTPIGVRVGVTRERWQLIVTTKHPVMAGREADVKAALETPDEVRESRSDRQVFLFYKAERVKRWVCAVAKETDTGGVSDHGVPDGRNQGGHSNMAEVKVFYDREGHTLTVWFTDMSREYVCEETGDEVVLMKDATGRVIGFEKLNFSIPDSEPFRVASETVPA